MSTTPKTKSPLNPKAIKLLRRVQEHILAEPRRYDQEVFARVSESTPCGMAACIAGWCDILSQNPRPSRSFLNEWQKTGAAIDSWQQYGNNIERRALHALGILKHEYDHPAAELFTGDPARDWPSPFCQQWSAARTARRRAQIAVARIEHFIQTGE